MRRLKANMAKTDFYRQCVYKQIAPSGFFREAVAWLPEKLAKVGKKIYFGAKREASEDELWTVSSVGEGRRSADWLTFKRNADKGQRQASDI